MDYIDIAIQNVPQGHVFTAYELFGHDMYASIQLYRRLSIVKNQSIYMWLNDNNGRHNYIKL